MRSVDEKGGGNSCMEVHRELRGRLGSVRGKGVDKKKAGKSCIVWLYMYDLRDRIGCKRAKSSDKKRSTTRVWLYVWKNIAKRIDLDIPFGSGLGVGISTTAPSVNRFTPPVVLPEWASPLFFSMPTFSMMLTSGLSIVLGYTTPVLAPATYV